MSRGPDAATLFERALSRAADDAGVAIVVLVAESARWASATFTGARHQLRIELSAGEQADRWLADLAEHEFALRNHLVADLAIVSRQREADVLRVTIEALTVEER